MAAARLLVLLSGSGRTMTNLHDRCRAGELDAEIAGVVASRECLGARISRERGLPTRVIPGVIPADELADLADGSEAAWIVCAGYLRLVDLSDRTRGRVVNIHPALLPGDGTAGRFGGPGMHGLRVHEAVLAAGEAESGCTVHFCDDRFDAGEVILRRTCPVLPGDTPRTLADRVFALELEAYPEALQRLIDAGRTKS